MPWDCPRTVGSDGSVGPRTPARIRPTLSSDVGPVTVAALVTRLPAIYNGPGSTRRTGMARGCKTGGRQAGTPNKLTREMREMLLEALDRAGGVEYLAKQAIESPRAFMSLLGKLIPRPVAAEQQGATLEDILAASWDRPGPGPGSPAL